MPATEHTISVGAILKIVFAVVLVTALYQIIDILAILFLGIVIASALDPVILRLKRYHIPRVGSAIIIYLAVFFGFAAFFYFLIPPIIDEGTRFLDDFPRIQQNLMRSDVVRAIPFSSLLNQNILELSQNGLGILKGIGGNFLNVSSQIFGGVLSFVLLVVISFYLSMQENGVTRFLQAILPLRYEAYAIEVWDRARRKLGTWLQAMFILMAIVGTLVYVSMSIVGIKFAFLLGVLSGLFEIIPIVGPILGAIPGVTLGLLQSPATGLLVLLVYITIQQVENHVFVPLIMQKAIGLNPIVIVVALLIGGKLGGVMGLLIAVPLATVIVEVIEDIDRRRRITG